MNNNIITCPHCGYEYLPEEIYNPNVFFGRPLDIIRDKKGKIEFFWGDSLDVEETFECFNCNHLFTIKALVEFKTTKIEPLSEVFETSTNN